MLEFRSIDSNNFRDVLALSIEESQMHFVATNAYSLAQAKAQPECVPMALYDGETLVGFLMYGMDVDDREYWLYRLMIDRRFQSRGYGRKALCQLLTRLQGDPAHRELYLSCNPENAWGRILYESMGFRPDGRTIHGEMVYRLLWN